MAAIVVGVDGSRESRAALRFALEEARRWGSTLHVVYAWRHATGGLHTYPTGEKSEPRTRAQEEEAWLGGFVGRVARGSEVEIVQSAVEGSPAQVLLEAAKDAELLVVGSRGRGGFAGLLLGSVSHQCAEHAPCPVVIVRRRDRMMRRPAAASQE